jgi:hypothetical protein
MQLGRGVVRNLPILVVGILKRIIQPHVFWLCTHAAPPGNQPHTAITPTTISPISQAIHTIRSCSSIVFSGLVKEF